MTSREIVEMAYRHDLVPPRLYGKTQHKTVGARLSEDILARRERSAFFRSEPGKFFLREFITDASISAAYRSPFTAKRRLRELRRGAPLAISRSEACAASIAARADTDLLRILIEACHFHYGDPADRSGRADELHVWSFVMFRRGLEVLTYRHGRYREGRDSFLKRRSVGFFTRVVDRDLDLFDEGDHGIVASGLRAIAFDLDLPHIAFGSGPDSPSAKIADIVIAQDTVGREDLLTVISMECPSHFEPLTRRLAINDLNWMRLDLPINHIEDFDPWSQAVIQRTCRPNQPLGI